MVGGGWRTHSNRRARPMGSLSAWCDLNLPSAKGAKIATLVASREQAQEKPTDSNPPEPMPRALTDSDAMPAITTETRDLERLDTVTLAFLGVVPSHFKAVP